MEVVIKTEKLCKTFSRGGNQQHILKNLDMEIRKGDFTVIMGPSGAGKSTLLYALSGMDKPTLGKIVFEDEEISKYNNDELAVFRRLHCGFVFQQIYLLDRMSVLDNIMASGLLVSKHKKQIAMRAKQLLIQVGMKEESWHKFPSQLSGGEAQRVGIVRSLINQPEIIFADEPTGQLNSSASDAVLDIFSALHAQGQSIIMVTHDLKSARRGNRILYLQDGYICGECELGSYVPKDHARHEKLSAFLKEMGW